jgi:hypothetical protein
MSYFIERWDVIIENGHQKPVVYIKPDSKLLNYFEKNDQVSVYMRGTKSPYEKQICYARIVPPSCMYGYRPNVAMVSPAGSPVAMLCLIIEAVWYGYPIGDLGIVDILQLEKRPVVYPPRRENAVFFWVLIALFILLLYVLYNR